MNRHIVYRTIPLALPAALLLCAPLGLMLGWSWAICFGMSALWGALNLWALCQLLDAIVLHQSVLRGLIALHLKALTLLGGLWLLVSAPWFAGSAFVSGFHVIFALLALRMIWAERALAREAH